MKNFYRLLKGCPLYWCDAVHHFFDPVSSESGDVTGPRHPVDDEHVVTYVYVYAVRAEHSVYFAQEGRPGCFDTVRLCDGKNVIAFDIILLNALDAEEIFEAGSLNVKYKLATDDLGDNMWKVFCFL